MSGEDKTEKATPKRLSELRKKGSAARSVELPAGVSLLALVLVLPRMVGGLWEDLQTSMATVLGGADVTDLGSARGLAGGVLVGAVRSVAPMLAVVMVAGLLSGVLVTRQKPNPHALKPQWARMSPKSSVKRMFSSHSAVDLLKVLVKLSLLALVTWQCWQDGWTRLLSAAPTPDGLRAIVGDETSQMLWRVALLALLVGLGDAAWQRRSFGKQAKMTKQEIKDEHKQSEGDPHVKGQRRSLMLAMSRARMISAVPAADVVLANPTHLVVALKYEPGSAAPVVVARGAGAVADRIKQVARDSGVPVIADKPLARALYKATEVGDTIPVELFRAVAEVLAVVYAAKRRGVAPAWNRESVLA